MTALSLMFLTIQSLFVAVFAISAALALLLLRKSVDEYAAAPVAALGAV